MCVLVCVEHVAFFEEDEPQLLQVLVRLQAEFAAAPGPAGASDLLMGKELLQPQPRTRRRKRPTRAVTCTPEQAEKGKPGKGRAVERVEDRERGSQGVKGGGGDCEDVESAQGG